jgi:ATP-dependent Lon protease
VLVPADNENEAFNVPDYVKQNLKITLVKVIKQVLEIALLK